MAKAPPQIWHFEFLVRDKSTQIEYNRNFLYPNYSLFDFLTRIAPLKPNTHVLNAILLDGLIHHQTI